jgi:hypothetical protein
VCRHKVKEYNSHIQYLNVKVYKIDPRCARQYYLIYREINIPMNNIITQEEKDHIDQVCDRYTIKNYSINSDGSIDVDGDVDLFRCKLHELPLKFGKVNGNFNCGQNEFTSLRGCPKTIGGDFRCDGNKLTSLEFSPISVGGDFSCNNNQLTSLEGCPTEIGGYFSGNINKLTSLEGSPNMVGGDFTCTNNKLTSLEGCPTEIGGDFLCRNNQLTSLEGCPKYVGGGFRCDENKLTSLEFCPTEIGRYFNCSVNQLTSLEFCPTEIGGDFSCSVNRFPEDFDDSFDRLSYYEQYILVKYQSYYDVWTPEFNIDGFNELVAEIRDGLR